MTQCWIANTMFMNITFITAHFLQPSWQLTSFNKHIIIMSSCKEFMCYGIVHYSTHTYTRNIFILLQTNVLRYIHRSSVHVLIPWSHPWRNLLCIVLSWFRHCVCYWGALQRAPVNTSKHTQHSSHVYYQLSHTNCTAMCMLICNIHYCRLAVESTSKLV